MDQYSLSWSLSRPSWFQTGRNSCRQPHAACPGDAELYAELTGRPVSGAAMQMYQIRWSLDDIALAISDFRPA